MAVLRSSKANPSPQAARIPAKDPSASESRSERHPYSQTLTKDPAFEENPKDPPATEPLTPECTSRQQQSSSDLQTDLQTRGAPSGEPSTTGNPPMAPPTLESPSHGQPTTNSPSGDCQPAARNPPMAEDPSRIPVAEVNRMGVSTSNSQPVLKLRTLLVAVAALSRLGSAGVNHGTERIINDSNKEIGDSNELLSSGTGCHPPRRAPNQDLRTGLIEHKNPTITLHYSEKINSEDPGSQTHKHDDPSKDPPTTSQPPLVLRALGSSSCGPQALEKTIHEDIEKGRYECIICMEKVNQVSRIWSCQSCSRVFHFHCVKQWVMKDFSEKRLAWKGGRCPGCNMVVIKLDRSRHPKRKVGEMSEPIIIHPNDIHSAITVEDDDDEPPLKKHKGAMMLRINSLIRTTKAELAEAVRGFHRMRDDRSKHCLDQLLRRRICLGDARRYILDREMEPMASDLHDTTLLAIHGLITENKREMAKVMREFYDVHKGGINDKMDGPSTVLWASHSQLQRRHKRLMETRKYILDLASSASSRGS